MQKNLVSREKALAINLDPTIYGTFSEIGAGQEVGRHFFKAGGASGTVAKTMSAYDMAFSDAIYGAEENRRYVSESRCFKMLNHEFGLLEQRLVDEKYDGRRFFVYANTVTTLNYMKTNDPHGWMGVQFQLKPDEKPSTVVLHVRMLDNHVELQQHALGDLGVNLLHACYYHHNDIEDFLERIMDNIGCDQIDIDAIKFEGEHFENVDNRLVALSLVQRGYTDATIFTPDGTVQQPKDLLYKKSVLVSRGRFRPVTHVNLDMEKAGVDTFLEDPDVDADNLVVLSEITLNYLKQSGDVDINDFISRVEILCSLGKTVMISNYHKHHDLVDYLSLCTRKKVGIIIGIFNLLRIFDKKYYENFNREIINSFVNIFGYNAKLLAYPYQPHHGLDIITTEKLNVPDEVEHLYKHLCASGFLVDIDGFDPEVLHIFSDKVLELIKKGEDGWEEMVPKEVADIVKEKCLFDYPCPVK